MEAILASHACPTYFVADLWRIFNLKTKAQAEKILNKIIRIHYTNVVVNVTYNQEVMNGFKYQHQHQILSLY